MRKMMNSIRFLRILTLLWLLAIGGPTVWADSDNSSSAGNSSKSSTEELLFDFTADQSLLSGLETDITNLAAKPDVEISVNDFPIQLHSCLRSGSRLAIRGDYSVSPGYVSGAMHGTLLQMKLQKTNADAGNVTLSLENAEGKKATIKQSINGKGEKVITIPEADQMQDATLIKVAPDCKCIVSSITLVRKAYNQDYKDPWVIFQKWNGENIPIEDTETHYAKVGQILKLASNGIEGFDPVSAPQNPYVVVYTVDGSEPGFSNVQDDKGNWKNGNDKDANGNAIGKNGYIYRRGIVLSNVKLKDDGTQDLDHEFQAGNEVTVRLAIYKLTKDGETTSAEKIKDITKKFTLESSNRPLYGTEDNQKHIKFSPTTMGAHSGDKYDKSMTIMDPTEFVNVYVTNAWDGNTLIAKFSHNDSYDLQSLLNAVSVTPRRNKANMKSSALGMRKISAMQLTPEGIACQAVAEAYYWYIPARKQVYLEATMDHSTLNVASGSNNNTSKVTVKAYQLKDENLAYSEDNRELLSWNTDLTLVKDSITMGDNNEIAILTSDAISYSADNKEAYFTVRGIQNGQTHFTIRTGKTRHIKEDGSTDNISNYTAAQTSCNVTVTGGGMLTPPTIDPHSGYYSKTFTATVKGYEGVKTYYLLHFLATSSGEISTLSADADIHQNMPENIPTGAEFIRTVNEAIAAPDQEISGGIIDGATPQALTISGNVGAHYILYAMAYDEKGEKDENKYSRVTWSDYQYNKLADPVCSPGISDENKYYTFSDETLDIGISVTDSCAIYYSLNAPLQFKVENGKVITNGKIYDASSKIELSKSSNIYAIAYREDLGITSDIVCYKYAKKATDLDNPYYCIGTGTYKDGTKYHEALTDKEIQIKATVYKEDGTALTIGGEQSNINWSTDTYHIYYTLDGTTPTGTENERYEKPFKVDDATFTGTIIACVIADGVNGDNSVSETSTLTAFDPKKDYWETTTDNCPGGVLANKHVTLQKDGEDVMYVEFGGEDTDTGKIKWKHYTSKEHATGEPINGVGYYTIAPADDTQEGVADAKDELDKYYNHSLAKTDDAKNFQTHKATYNLPAKGAYVKFEPTTNGKLTIWCCQEGALYYNNSSTAETRFNDAFMRKRPAYFIDETGKSYKPSDLEVAGTLSSNWFTDYNLGHWIQKGKSQNGIEQKLYTQQQTQNIYQMFNEHILAQRTAGKTTLKDFIIYLNDGTHNDVAGYNVTDKADRAEGNNTGFVADEVVDGTGICLPSASYMKYTFDVKAGKTYFFFGWMTKIGIRGFAFEPSTDESNTLSEPLTIHSGNSATNHGDSDTNDFTQYLQKKCSSVTVDRNFKVNTWTSLVLPFSVSTHQLEKTFGKGTQVLHYRTIEGRTMYFFKHYHQMIVAGTPILIKPTEAKDGVTFTNMTIESTEVTDKPCNDYDYEDKNNTDYQMIGSYKVLNMPKYSYYLGSDNKVYQQDWIETYPLYGTRAYMIGTKADGTSTAVESMAKAAYNHLVPESMNDETTDIDFIGIGKNEDSHLTARFGKANVYSIDGQLVGKSQDDLKRLAKGVYIVNGQKVIVE